MALDPTLHALLTADVTGDRVARQALADYLEEQGDPRAEAVRAEKIDWNGVARKLEKDLNGSAGLGTYHRNRLRWLIDCCLVGDRVPEYVRDAVEQARRRWAARLFRGFR